MNHRCKSKLKWLLSDLECKMVSSRKWKDVRLEKLSLLWNKKITLFKINIYLFHRIAKQMCFRNIWLKINTRAKCLLNLRLSQAEEDQATHQKKPWNWEIKLLECKKIYQIMIKFFEMNQSWKGIMIFLDKKKLKEKHHLIITITG